MPFPAAASTKLPTPYKTTIYWDYFVLALPTCPVRELYYTGTSLSVDYVLVLTTDLVRTSRETNRMVILKSVLDLYIRPVSCDENNTG